MAGKAGGRPHLAPEKKKVPLSVTISPETSRVIEAITKRSGKRRSAVVDLMLRKGARATMEELLPALQKEKK